jgi:hypothetical protein
MMLDVIIVSTAVPFSRALGIVLVIVFYLSRYPAPKGTFACPAESARPRARACSLHAGEVDARADAFADLGLRFGLAEVLLV